MSVGFGSTSTNATLMEFVVPEASVLGVLTRCSQKLTSNKDISDMVNPMRESVASMIRNGTENIRRLKVKFTLKDEKGHVAMLSVETSGAEDDKVKLNISIASHEFTVLPEYVRIECGKGNALIRSKGFEMVPVKPTIGAGHIAASLSEMAKTTIVAADMLNTL